MLFDVGSDLPYCSVCFGNEELGVTNQTSCGLQAQVMVNVHRTPTCLCLLLGNPTALSDSSPKLRSNAVHLKKLLTCFCDLFQAYQVGRAADQALQVQQAPPSLPPRPPQMRFLAVPRELQSHSCVRSYGNQALLCNGDNDGDNALQLLMR